MITHKETAKNENESQSDDGIVKERKKYFENLSLDDSPKSGRASNYEFLSELCIQRRATQEYNQNSNPRYHKLLSASLDKRMTRPPFFWYDEDQAFVTLKSQDRETEHFKIRRYESILKPPLSQQLGLMNCRGIKSNKTAEESLQNFLSDNNILNWSENKLVQSSKLLSQLSQEQVMFQESQFELIASEASYYRSLNVLIDKFYHSQLLSLQNCNDSKETFSIKAHQKEHLFSNILQIHSISGKFLASLEKRFSKSILMKDICDIVSDFAKHHFEAYIPYIQNQRFQNKAYKELKKNEKSAKIIEVLESQPECYSLSLDSFLILPMQRLLKILLLLKAIKKHVPKAYSSALKSVEAAIRDVDKIVSQCDSKKGLMDERQRMLEISSLLRFKAKDAFFSISSGTLLHEGEMKCYPKNMRVKSYLSSIRNTVYDAWLILTDQCLLITRLSKSKELSYLVEDWCSLADLVVKESPLSLNDDKTFSVVFRKESTYSMQTKSKEEFTKWINELTSII